MWPGRASAVMAAVALGAAAAPADATVLCVDPARSECLTLRDAFAEAGDGDRIVIAALTDDTPVSSDRKIDVTGGGEEETRLGALELTHEGATVADLRVGALDLAGIATAVRVDGVARLRGTARLRSAEVGGGVAVAGADADAGLHSVVIRAHGGVALEACNNGELRAWHVTVTGTGDGAARACAGAVLALRDAIVAGEFTEPLDGPVTTGATVLGDATLVDADGRLPPGSPLIDAGTPGPLIAGTPFEGRYDDHVEDRDRVPRVADGDGDGVLERDPGAFEAQPPATPVPAGNLLLDPGAETGGAWAFSDGFTRALYGSYPFPSLVAGAALGAGKAFFAGGPAEAATATQRVDVGGVAPEIDRGTASATLSGLLGGFRADADAGALEATFVDPAGLPLGTVSLTAPSAADRANASVLLPRARADAVPPLTRAIDVRMRATRMSASYDDAYFDNLALTLVAPGAPPAPPPPGPGDPPLRPFVGIRAITALATVDRQGRIGIRLLCPTATVGRCVVTLTLTGRLQRGGARATAGYAEAEVAPDGLRRVRIRLTRRAQRAVRARGRIKMVLFTTARDGQGLTLDSTIPLTVQWPRKPARRR